MENNPFKPPQGQGTRPSFKFEKGDRDRPKAGIGGKIMIVAMGGIGGGVIGGALTFYSMARASGRGRFNPDLDRAYLMLGIGALIGAIVGIVGVLRILREESK